MGISRLVKLFPISFLLVPCVISAAAEVVTEGLVLNYDFTAGSMPGADSAVKDLSGNRIDGVMRPIGPFTPRIPRTGWLDHRIFQGNGQGGWISRPAKIQLLKKPTGISTIPFGVVTMDNGEIALICSWNDGRSERPVIAFSKDAGQTWTKFQSIPGATGRPLNLAYLGKGRLTFCSNKRFFSSNFGRTWPDSTTHQPTSDGFRFDQEGNAWVAFDANGNATRIAELGWHYKEGKWPTGTAVTVIRWSSDGGRTWDNEVHPETWIYDTEHAGKTYRRGVSEGALVGAENGWLVAAVRTDMPPRFFGVPHSDHFEGTAVSISKDDGKTWSELNWLFDAGRMHANLQAAPNGDLVMTVVVRQDIITGSMGRYASFRRGCDALVSHDNGQTWDLSRKYTLYAFDFPDSSNRYPVVCGHIGAAVLDDGSVISASGDYPRGATVLVKWTPGAEPARPASEEELNKEAVARGTAPADTIYNHTAQRGKHYEVRGKPGETPELLLNGAGWVHVPLDDRILNLKHDATIEFILRPEDQGTFAYLLACSSISSNKPDLIYQITFDHTRTTNNPQVIFSDERVDRIPMRYSVMVHSDGSPKAFEPVMQQIAYVVNNGKGTFYRDGKPFSHQTTDGLAAMESLFQFCLEEAGDKEQLRLGIGARPRTDRAENTLRAGLAAVRIYNRPLTPQELNRNRTATLSGRVE